MQGRPFELTDTDFNTISSMVYEKTGIVLAEHKRNMVYSRLSRRLRALNFETFAEYISYVQGRGAAKEMESFINSITTNLTSFFREGHHFEHLKKEVLEPLLSSRTNTKRLRIWSAGCSKGAEPYSIAMVLASCLEKYKGWDAKILATDIDTSMLAHGRAGIYDDKDFEAIPSQYHRYVTQQGRELLMKPAIKQLITFNPLNLLEEWPMKGTFDIIFCRNVVIYFDTETQRKLFARYHKILKENGHIYIGHSENLLKVSQDFKSEGKTIYRPV